MNRQYEVVAVVVNREVNRGEELSSERSNDFIPRDLLGSGDRGKLVLVVFGLRDRSSISTMKAVKTSLHLPSRQRLDRIDLAIVCAPSTIHSHMIISSPPSPELFRTIESSSSALITGFSFSVSLLLKHVYLR